MKLFADLEADLVRDEGEVLHAYQDSLGYWTIGVGRMIDKRRGGGITSAEARHLLRADIQRTHGLLLISWPPYGQLDEPRQRVLLNMAFNLGIGGLMQFKATLQYVQDGDYAAAAAAMLKSKWAKQVGQRAARLARLMQVK